MPKYHVELDAVLRALADPTRRAVVERLATSAAVVSELAAPFAMALPSFLQHLRVLEDAGVVTSDRAHSTCCTSVSASSARPRNARPTGSAST